MTAHYDDNYVEQAFWIWYNKGKLNANALVTELSLVFGEKVPHAITLSSWIKDNWRERAEELDKRARDEFSAEVIHNKVAMLRRHAEVGKELQEIGLKWIRENKDQLTANTVARLIKDGYEIERASVGVPEALEKMLSTSDDELIKQIEAAITDEDLDLLNADK